MIPKFSTLNAIRQGFVGTRPRRQRALVDDVVLKPGLAQD